MSIEWTSRKLWVSILGMVFATSLHYWGKLGDDAWSYVMIACVLGYPMANVAQKVLDK